MFKKISVLLCALAAIMVACDVSTPLTQQDVVDKVTAEITKGLSDASKFKMEGCSIDTIAANSPFIDPDAYPNLFGAALYMNIVDKAGDLVEKTHATEDLDQMGELLDSVRNYMVPVMKRVDELKTKPSTPAGYIVCIDYNDGSEDKSETYYYDIASGSVEKKSWEPDVFGRMLMLLEEFTAKPELLKED